MRADCVCPRCGTGCVKCQWTEPLEQVVRQIEGHAESLATLIKKAMEHAAKLEGMPVDLKGKAIARIRQAVARGTEAVFEERDGCLHVSDWCCVPERDWT